MSFHNSFLHFDPPDCTVFDPKAAFLAHVWNVPSSGITTLFEILHQHMSSSSAAGFVRSATWSNAKPIDCVGKKVQSRQSSQRRPHRNRTTTTRLVGQRKKKTMIAAKASSSPPQEEEKTQSDQKKFIPAHMRKTVSRITEAQMKEKGVELAKASEQVQESIGTSVV